MIETILADPAFLVVAIAAAFFVGLGKGGMPVIANLAVPLMSLFMLPVMATALLLPTYIVSDMVGLALYRRHFSKRNLAILIPAALIGVGLGWATAAFVDDHWVKLLVGLVGVGYCLDTWLRNKANIAPKPARVGPGLFWGLVAGFVSFVSHSGGPPYQVYALPQRMPKLVFAGTSTILFAAVNAAKIVPYWSLGTLNLSNFKAGMMLVPLAVLGAIAGAWLIRVMPEKTFYTAVQVALFLVSLKLIYDAIWG